MSETADQNVITTQPKISENKPNEKDQKDSPKEENKDEKSKLETGKGCVDAFKDMFHQIAAICMHSTVLYKDLKKDCDEGGCFKKCNCYADGACCGDDGCLEKLCYSDKGCCSEGSCDCEISCFSDGCCDCDDCYDCCDCGDCGCDDCCDCCD